MIADGILRLAAIDARLALFDWAFAREEAGPIAAHWARRVAKSPALYDGRVLLQHAGVLDGETLRAAYFETAYSAFLAWRDFGFPGQGTGQGPRNGFAMAALRAADGAFLLGVMAPHTATAGRVYFPAGTPDLDDVTADGRIDLAGSVSRELLEETGLSAPDVSFGADWTAVVEPSRIAFMRPVAIDCPAEEARALIRANLAREAQPELADIAIVRGPHDIDDSRMPSFMRTFLEHAFATA